ncbi:MAG: carboxypeptidase regulatory-like domain-containing protein [Nitrospiraceae bacterium]|nr:carboxypeptidase regulatory-like domain-containing protein [Nitrospiraceae bacterium]
MRNSTSGRADFVTLRAFIRQAVLGWVTVWLGSLLAGLPAAMAMHETDHRFTVEGSVCGADGEPVSGIEVLAKDARISVLSTALTDEQGYYKVTLHLHNDNKGDPIVVYVKDKAGTIQREQQITAQFDPKDVQTERKTTVNFGSGCESLAGGPPPWMYYGAGLAVLAGGAWAGATLLRGRKRQAKGGRGGKR